MEPNCEYATLHLSANGYIVKCHHCAHYQLAFGNLMFKITEQEYEEFKSSVRSTRDDFRYLKDTEEARVKNISLQIYYYGVSLILNYKEVEVLVVMLHEADSKEILQKLLHYSKN